MQSNYYTLLQTNYYTQATATSADNWCEENKMELSFIKTNVALVGSRQRLNKMTDTEKEINIFINAIQLEQITRDKREWNP